MQARIRDSYQQVLERIARAAQSAGRDPATVKLVVVTKGHSLEVTQATIEAGARCLGENYVEEALPKILALGDQTEVEWHMIGHVQSRKARPVCAHFHWLHSLDRLKLATRIARFAVEFGRGVPVLLECNVSGEETRFGWPAWRERQWADLLPPVEQILSLSHLQVRGLMTMAPFLPDPEGTRPYFQRLRGLRDYLARHFPQADWSQLSMGMSADYPVAIQEGATMVRIGTAILGERPR